MIAIIDYGLGNVRAFTNVYKNLDIPITIATKADDLKKATKVILPGVGAFDHAMQRLEKSGMRQFIDEIVLHLGWINGEVKRFNPSSLRNSIRLPHMGWNNIKPLKSNGLLQGLDLNARFYFLHSYFFHGHRNEGIIAVTDYHGEFACAVNFRNIYGVQFHPEKSHQWGIRLLENFAKI